MTGGRRDSDRTGLARVWGRWGRDFWLLLVTALVVWTAFDVRQVADDLVTTRATAVSDACTADTTQADVMRAILEASLAQRRQREREGRPAPDGLTVREAEQLADALLKPLGGLRPTPHEKRQLCASRVRRGTPGI